MDNIDITVIEQPIAVTQAITESPVNIAIAVTDAPLDVNIAVDENTLSVAVAVTESPVAVSITSVQGIGEAPIDGETYGRKDGDWVPVVSGGGTWGSITGTLSEQLDLQAALDTKLSVESDPIFTASEAALFATGDKAKLDGIEAGAQINVPETDPIFAASAAASILLSDLANWNSKLSAETDPIFLASVAASITLGDITNWNAKQDALGFTPVDSASANWLALTSGGETALHSHAGGGGAWGSITGILSNQTDLQTALNAKQNTLTLPLSPANGGTGVNNAGTLTNASNTTITGGGTLTLGGFTLTVPATLTAAGLAIANAFTALQTITVPTATTEALILKTSDDSATKNVLELHDSAGAKMAVFNRRGNPTIGGAANRDEELKIKNSIYTFAFTERSSSYAKPGVAQFNLQSGQDLEIVNSSTVACFFVDASLRFVGIGTELTTIPAPLYVETRQTTTNAVIELARLQAQVSTAATGSAAGFGTGLTFYAETATDGTNQQQGLISTSWTTATNASRKAKMSLSAYDTAARLGIEIQASGTEAMLGFYGVTPIARAVLATGTGKTVDDVITALQNLGLVKQS